METILQDMYVKIALTDLLMLIEKAKSNENEVQEEKTLDEENEVEIQEEKTLEEEDEVEIQEENEGETKKEGETEIKMLENAIENEKKEILEKEIQKSSSKRKYQYFDTEDCPGSKAVFDNIFKFELKNHTEWKGVEVEPVKNSPNMFLCNYISHTDTVTAKVIDYTTLKNLIYTYSTPVGIGKLNRAFQREYLDHHEIMSNLMFQDTSIKNHISYEDYNKLMAKERGDESKNTPVGSSKKDLQTFQLNHNENWKLLKIKVDANDKIICNCLDQNDVYSFCDLSKQDIVDLLQKHSTESDLLRFKNMFNLSFNDMIIPKDESDEEKQDEYVLKGHPFFKKLEILSEGAFVTKCKFTTHNGNTDIEDKSYMQVKKLIDDYFEDNVITKKLFFYYYDEIEYNLKEYKKQKETISVKFKNATNTNPINPVNITIHELNDILENYTDDSKTKCYRIYKLNDGRYLRIHNDLKELKNQCILSSNDDENHTDVFLKTEKELENEYLK